MNKIADHESIKNLPQHPAYGEAINYALERIKKAQNSIAIAANIELVHLYWDLGKLLSQLQAAHEWGALFVTCFAKDLQKHYPQMAGFSRSNLFRMKAFYLAYKGLERDQDLIKLPIFQISWTNNVIILEKVDLQEARLWYAQKAHECSWTKRALKDWIERDIFSTEGKAISNFEDRLPLEQSSKAHKLLKDPYVLEITLAKKEFLERELEENLIENIRKFLMALGQGFAFVGNQYRLEVGKKTHFLDLLFYHTKLHCYVVVEIKCTEFKATDAGQLNYYLSAVDDQLREEEDNPTIGILLCKDKDHLEVEYSLRDLTKPIGVATYKTHRLKTLPPDLQNVLPTLQDFQSTLLQKKKIRNAIKQIESLMSDDEE